MFKKTEINIRIEIIVPEIWNKLKLKTKEKYINEEIKNKNIIKLIEILED